MIVLYFTVKHFVRISSFYHLLKIGEIVYTIIERLDYQLN